MLEWVIESWLKHQCEMLPRAVAGVVLLSPQPGVAGVPSVAAVPMAAWPAQSGLPDDLLALARSSREASKPMAEPAGQRDRDSAAFLNLACPIWHDKTQLGVVAVRVASQPGAQKSLLQLLRWGAKSLALILRLKDSSAAHDAVLLRLAQRLLKEPDDELAITTLATELAELFRCGRVSLGLSSRGRIRLRALSHGADFDRRSPLAKAIEAVFAEANGQEQPVIFPAAGANAAPAHADLTPHYGSVACCTVVLRQRGESIGAMALERFESRAFGPDEVRFAAAVAETLAPILALCQCNRRPLAALFGGDAGSATPVRRRRRHGGAIAAAVVIGLTTASAFIPWQYRVGAPATVEATVQRAVVVPFDGYLAAAHASAGETVTAGAVMAELESRELTLQRRRWQSERDAHAKHFREALAQLDHAQTRILRAKMDQAQTRIESVDDRLARLRLMAPIDGVVISGDLSRSIGTPLDQGEVLFEIAPPDRYAVALQVDERDIGDISPGQSGELRLAAMSDRVLPIVVKDVLPVSRSQDGQTRFRVEAELESSADGLRPGMQGTGKVAIGERSLLWIWTRRLATWLQLRVWSWLP